MRRRDCDSAHRRRLVQGLLARLLDHDLLSRFLRAWILGLARFTGADDPLRSLVLRQGQSLLDRLRLGISKLESFEVERGGLIAGP